MRVLYLGISGVLHPSASIYELVYGFSPWDAGHRKYEAVQWLSPSLTRWSDVRIVLTSTLPRRDGLPVVLENLGALADRVIGHTYEDLTTRVLRHVRTRSGLTRQIAFSDEDYGRMHKSGIVAAHLTWLKPREWVVVDDDDILWPKVSAEHVCIVDGLAGLQHPGEQDKLLTCLEVNFGRGDRR